MSQSKKSPPYGLVLLILCNTVLFFGVYCFFVMRKGIGWLFWLYFNRGISIYGNFHGWKDFSPQWFRISRGIKV